MNGEAARRFWLHWLFCKVYFVSFGIPHYIFSRPVGVECFHELDGLFKLVSRCYVYEFAALELPEHAIHVTSTSSSWLSQFAWNLTAAHRMGLCWKSQLNVTGNISD
jgi:hypothetical protein